VTWCVCWTVLLVWSFSFWVLVFSRLYTSATSYEIRTKGKLRKTPTEEKLQSGTNKHHITSICHVSKLTFRNISRFYDNLKVTYTGRNMSYWKIIYCYYYYYYYVYVNNNIVQWNDVVQIRTLYSNKTNLRTAQRDANIEDSSVFSYSWLEIEISGQVIRTFRLESLGTVTEYSDKIFIVFLGPCKQMQVQYCKLRLGCTIPCTF
jgi:hypothetical protein